LVRPPLPRSTRFPYTTLFRSLPVFVRDRYESLEPRYLQDFTPDERHRYVDANAAALRDLLPADLVFVNHVLMGGPVGAATGRPRSEEHTSELQSLRHLVCRLL